MGLVFSADFLHTYSMKIFLIKYPIKCPSFTIWRVWPKGLKYRSVPGSTPLGTQLLFGCSTANGKALPKGQFH